ncbi:Alkaline phosphatase, placental type [Schistosoma japonicum]|uniref:alkaline phosphatase n=1 Tax=Schistosoma japonicum TaxID=6182 RepID=A0A4Z2DEL9_SCHJA|nr:Alkaline phosphatase, placental type [Schistosoma japonicum]
MVTMLLTSQKALLLFITFILLQYDTECRKSLLNVEDPETWRKLADEKFNKFEKSLYYSLTKRPKNVIIFIGDGMSLNTVTGARYLKAENMDLLGGDVQLVWDDWPVASLVRTFNSDRLTTDSGSAATAFLSGAKGPDGTVGITGTVKCCKCTELRDLERAKSSLKYASNAGLSTGIVTTTRVTHATPAAAYANLLHRNWESNAEISDSGFNCSDAAAQLIANASDINVVMGGGAAEFYGTLETLAFNTKGKRHDSRNLLLEWEEIQKKMSRKYAVIHTNDDFKRTDWASVDYVLGLFAPSHLAYRLENRDEPTLSDMTEAAIKILSHNNKGFLLLVEGGRIDHGHHISQAKNALTETLEMEKAIEKALSLVNKKETLIIVTADHSHVYGVVGYPTRNISVLDVDNTDKGKDNKSYLISAHYNGPRGLVNEIRSDPATENTFANNYTAQSLVRLPFSTHSAEDVPIYANGPYSELFHSSMDNTFIAHAIMYSLCIGPYTHQSHCVSKPTSGTQLTGFRQHSYHYVVFLCILLYNFLH